MRNIISKIWIKVISIRIKGKRRTMQVANNHQCVVSNRVHVRDSEQSHSMTDSCERRI